MPPELSFLPEQIYLKQSIIIQNAQIPQEATDKLSSLLEKDLDSNVSKSSMDVGRTNLFKVNIATIGPLTACNPYPIPLKCQKIIKEIWLLENVGWIFKS